MASSEQLGDPHLKTRPTKDRIEGDQERALVRRHDRNRPASTRTSRCRGRWSPCGPCSRWSPPWGRRRPGELTGRRRRRRDAVAGTAVVGCRPGRPGPRWCSLADAARGLVEVGQRLSPQLERARAPPLRPRRAGRRRSRPCRRRRRGPPRPRMRSPSAVRRRAMRRRSPSSCLRSTRPRATRPSMMAVTDGRPHGQAAGQARGGSGALGQNPQDPVLGQGQVHLGQGDFDPLGQPCGHAAVGAAAVGVVTRWFAWASR